jgi:MFS family permease
MPRAAQRSKTGTKQLSVEAGRLGAVTVERDVQGLWAPAVRQLTVGLAMTITLVAFESLSVATILPVVSRHLGDLRLYGWVFSAFFLASLVGTVVGGGLSDRTEGGGVRMALVGGLIVFAAGLAVAGAAPSMPVLVLGRVIQGFGAGMVPAAAYAAIGRSYPERLRPRMFATLSTAWVVPGLVGPALSAQVAEHAGWRWVFLGLLPLVAVTAAITLPALAGVPPARHPEGAGNAPLPLAASSLVAVGAGLILTGLTVDEAAVSPPLILVGVLLVVPSLRRLTPPGTLRARPGLPAAVLTRGLLTFGFFAADAYVPLTLTSVRHTSTTFAGITLTVSTIGWTAASWVQARFVRRRGPRPLVAGGLALVIAGIGSMATLLGAAVPIGVAVVAWTVAGFGIGLAYSPISLTALGWARRGEEGRISASVQLMDVLGTGLGTGVAGAAVAIVHQQHGSSRLGLGLAYAVAAAVAMVGLAVTPRLPNRVSNPVASPAEQA